MSRGQLFRAAALRHNASRRVRIQPGASDADARSDRGDEGEKATPTGLISIPREGTVARLADVAEKRYRAETPSVQNPETSSV